MRKGVPKRRTMKTQDAPISPINFRMPRELRARLRRFAQDRHLSESEALRLVVAEYLDDVESERELAEAERWQFQQAYATWERFLRGEGRTVPPEEIERIFTEALAEREPTKRAR